MTDGNGALDPGGYTVFVRTRVHSILYRCGSRNCAALDKNNNNTNSSNNNDDDDDDVADDDEIKHKRTTHGYIMYKTRMY